MICETCHKNKVPKILEDKYFILSFFKTSLNKVQTPICHDKMTHLAKNCVTLKELLDTFNGKQS